MNKLKLDEIKKFVSELVYRVKDDRVTELSAQLTYYLILSIFPFLIFFLNLIKFTPLADQEVLIELLRFLPYESKMFLYGLISDIVSNSNIGLLSFGAVFTIWSASNGILAIFKAVNRAYDVNEDRGIIKLRLLSIVFTFILFVLLIIILLLGLATTPLMEKYFYNYSFLLIALKILKIFLPFFGIILSLTLLYYISISLDKREVSFKDNLYGAIFSTLGIWFFSKAFSFYINNFGDYSKTYGSIGGIIILLIWMYSSSTLVILGAEINATLISMGIIKNA